MSSMVEWFSAGQTAREIAEASFASHDLSVSTTIALAANRVRANLAMGFNHDRLLEPIGYIPPAEAEADYYRQLASQVAVAA